MPTILRFKPLRRVQRYTVSDQQGIWDSLSIREQRVLFIVRCNPTYGGTVAEFTVRYNEEFAQAPLTVDEITETLAGLDEDMITQVGANIGTDKNWVLSPWMESMMGFADAYWVASTSNVKSERTETLADTFGSPRARLAVV